jgi:hypothetical protein
MRTNVMTTKVAAVTHSGNQRRNAAPRALKPAAVYTNPAAPTA